MHATTDAILTPRMLAERWGVDEQYVWDAVDDGDHPLPFLYLGRGLPQKGRRGKRGLYRFRSAAVEAWERGKETVFPSPIPGESRDVAAMAAYQHDGKLRGRRRAEARKV